MKADRALTQIEPLSFPYLNIFDQFSSSMLSALDNAINILINWLLSFQKHMSLQVEVANI